MRIVVIGGVAGGATAVTRLRRLDENAEIILIEKGEHVSFANCGLPYYVGGSISRRASLFVTSKEEMSSRYNIDIRLQEEVQNIDSKNKLVSIERLEDGSHYDLTYDKLLISTGSSPLVPNPDLQKFDNVFTLWNIPDVDKIMAFIDEKEPQKAVVVGGGFIGLEMVENLAERGLDVTLIEMADQVMPPLDKDMAKLVSNYLNRQNVKIMLSTCFERLEENGRKLITNSGLSIDADLVVLSIGVRPNSGFVQDSGLALNQRGGIKVDDLMQTSDPDIFAVGDVIEVNDYVLGHKTMVPLAGPANKQGRAVAANILGKKTEKYVGSLATSIAKIFDLNVASVGANEKTLQKQGLKYKEDYFISITHPTSHASYYPGSQEMTIKLIFAKDGIVLGAQIVGHEGVDKRIDTIATTMYFKGNVYDLARLELAYAPPFSSAKDPVNFAGYTAINTLEGLTDPITYQEYKENPSNFRLLDIREEAEFLTKSLPGGIHLPLSQIRERISELNPETNYLVYCNVGRRGYIAERVLKQKGIKAFNLIGGIKTAEALEEKPEDNYGENKNLGDRIMTNKGVSENDQINLSQDTTYHLEILDVCGLSCPGPIVEVSKAIQNLNDGDILDITATDPGFTKDIESWSKNTGNTLLEKSEADGKFKARLQKGVGHDSNDKSKDMTIQSINPNNYKDTSKEKTMIIFDGDLDKAIASFIIATGAAAMGNKVHMFFTFWGLSILRKPQKTNVKKDFMGKMFGMMLPKGSKKLGLSKMNFAGAGAKMIRSVMNKKGINSLEELIQEALNLGVELTACQMTMDIMGLKKEELIDGVQIGGVATMLNDSDNSNMNLFIS